MFKCLSYKNHAARFMNSLAEVNVPRGKRSAGSTLRRNSVHGNYPAFRNATIPGRCESSKVNLAERNNRITPMIRVIRIVVEKGRFPSTNNRFVRPHLVY